MNFVKCCVFSSTLIVAFSVAAATAADYVAIMIILFMNFIMLYKNYIYWFNYSEKKSKSEKTMIKQS